MQAVKEREAMKAVHEKIKCIENDRRARIKDQKRANKAQQLIKENIWRNPAIKNRK